MLCEYVLQQTSHSLHCNGWNHKVYFAHTCVTSQGLALSEKPYSMIMFSTRNGCSQIPEQELACFTKQTQVSLQDKTFSPTSIQWVQNIAIYVCR